MKWIKKHLFLILKKSSLVIQIFQQKMDYLTFLPSKLKNPNELFTTLKGEMIKNQKVWGIKENRVRGDLTIFQK